jgi:hypothetical protein
MMSETWNTKYGTRRVKKDPPTLDQAIFAAKGITDDVAQQTEIAASLMGLPVEEVRSAILRAGKTTFRMTTQIVRDTPGGHHDRAPQRAVIVERKISRKPLTGVTRRFGS